MDTPGGCGAGSGCVPYLGHGWNSDMVAKALLLLLRSRLSRVRLLATPWTAAHQAPPSRRFSRQEYWSGVPLPSPCKGFRKSENDLFNDTYLKLIFPSSLPTSVRNRVFGEGRHPHSDDKPKKPELIAPDYCLDLCIPPSMSFPMSVKPGGSSDVKGQKICAKLE